jgi:glycosyltransferase involved in cell wall biosynthesis
LERAKKMSQLKVAIAGAFPFPYGNAAASRVSHLAGGLSRANCEVHIVSFWGGADPQQSLHDPVSENVTVHRVALNQKLGKLTKAKLIFHSMSKLINSHKLDVLLLYGTTIDVVLPLFLSAKLSSLTVVTEVCEWFPPSVFKYGWFDRYFISEFIYRNFLPMFSDGAVCISTHIQSKLARFNRNVIIIPALGSRRDVSAPSSDESGGVFKVVYSGKFKQEDAAYLLIEAVRLCLKGGMDVRLEMIGGFDYEDEHYCKSLVNGDPVLKDRVSFVPQLSGDEYFRRIASASCLVLIRPHNKTNIANFPTRLPEFLWTGKPLIVSSAGDIEKYLKRGVHAHIIDLVNAETLASALGKIFLDREYAASLGEEGRMIAQAAFDYVKHGENLASFMQHLAKGRGGPAHC